MERDEGIYMSKRGQLAFESVSEFLQGKLARREAAELLSVTERTVSRIARIHCLEQIRSEHGS